MKRYTDTFVPRKQALNEELVALGHKVHVDERRKKLDKDKEKRKLLSQLEDEQYDW